MNLYPTLVFLHVLAAILGLGPLTVLAILSSSPAPVISVGWFARLNRIVGWGLGALLVTGVLIIGQTHGVLGKAGWTRVAVGLFVVLAVLHGIVRSRLKRNRDAAPDGALPSGLGWQLRPMCGLVAAITYLMEAKPW